MYALVSGRVRRPGDVVPLSLRVNGVFHILAEVCVRQLLSDRLQNYLGWFILASVMLMFAGLLFWPRADHAPPIFDVQMHYNHDAWHVFSVKAVIGTMRELDISYAAVSSAPNEGTFRLFRENILTVLPLLTPYRTIEDRHTWFDDKAIVEYLRTELDSGRYRGIGEIHLLDGQVAGPVVQFVVQQAVERRMVLLAHSDITAIRQLFRLDNRLRIIWAHAGMTTQPLQIDGMLYQYPGLFVELSHRTDLFRDGRLKPEWQELFLRYPDRFMVGTGTYNNSYWYEYRYTIRRIRKWLQELPADVAAKIGHKNALRLFLREG